MADIALSLHLMVKTLGDITEAAELIGAGQYNQQITPRSDDDALAHSINTMSRLLYENILTCNTVIMSLSILTRQHQQS